ncbi:MAG TPA: formylglycine-generating enzyme family protein [Planctomycetota bacterium]|nr:formylglycine-generating enzyme family protein [Planctomycetota bacterium]
MFRSTVLFAILAFVLTVPALADVPTLINYQGRLTDADGKPINGMRQMTFEFYDAATGGNQLPASDPFSETQTVTVTDGVFNVLIGSATEGGVPTSVFDGAEIYLSVKVEGEPLSPSQRIASVPYAFRALDAASVKGISGADIQTALADLQAFRALFWTLTIQPPEGNGSTTPGPGTYACAVGSASAPVTASVSSGRFWLFDHWEGTAVEGTATTNPITIGSGTGGQDRTLKAVFAEHLPIAPMCLVPAGTFRTSTGVDVYLDAYFIDTYEVTNELYCRFLNAGGNDDHWHSPMSGEISRTGSAAPYTYQPVSGFESRPVGNVTWFDATDFCTWRPAAEGLPVGCYSLPTEVQWEKAAGWGDPARTSLWTYAIQSDSIDCNRANYNYCVGRTTDVGSYTNYNSYYGCYDMSGNVLEWCSDWYGDAYPSSTSNPTGPTMGTYRVLRGGTWTYSASSVETGCRGRISPSVVVGNYGFRCARTVE